MAILCEGCGREYDVTLFQFGRTIHCACGARVGLEPVPARHAQAPRFAADAMLGGLARWLRVIGYDTTYFPDISDGALVRHALEEERVLLTRDRRLPEEWRIGTLLLVEGDAPMDRLRQVVRRYGLSWRSRLFTRCTVCNHLLEPAAREEVEGRVPRGALESADVFSRCPSCGRLYWEGSHTRRMRRQLEDALEG